MATIRQDDLQNGFQSFGVQGEKKFTCAYCFQLVIEDEEQ